MHHLSPSYPARTVGAAFSDTSDLHLVCSRLCYHRVAASEDIARPNGVLVLSELWSCWTCAKCVCGGTLRDGRGVQHLRTALSAPTLG